MVEKTYTSPDSHVSDWWPTVASPLRTFGSRLANFFTPSADAAITEDGVTVAKDIELDDKFESRSGI